MNEIVVVDENWAIGRDGDLLVHLPGDLKYYKEKTIGRHIVLGRKTLESFPGGRPLPGRENIVLTCNREFKNEHCRICYSMAELMLYIARLPSEDVFISGGGSMYRQMLPFCDTFYVTHILKTFEGADCYFPDLTAEEGIEKVSQSDIREENGVRYYFARYERKK